MNDGNHDGDPRDGDHLRLLAIFHFTFAGLATVGVTFLAAHYLVMRTVLTAAASAPEAADASLPPDQVIGFLTPIYTFGSVALIAMITLNVLAGRSLLTDRRYTLCLITAGLNCLSAPFGTALGVFTFIVLNRPTVRQRFNPSPTHITPKS